MASILVLLLKDIVCRTQREHYMGKAGVSVSRQPAQSLTTNILEKWASWTCTLDLNTCSLGLLCEAALLFLLLVLLLHDALFLPSSGGSSRARAEQ